MSDAIGLPPFAQEVLSKRNCRHCGTSLAHALIIAAGICHHPFPGGYIAFFYMTLCKCGGRTQSTIRSTLINQQTAPKLFESWAWREAVFLEDPKPGNPELLTNHSPMPGMTLLIRSNPIRSKQIFGGYVGTGEDPQVYLLCRWVRPDKQLVDGIIRIEPRNRIRIAQLPPEDKVKPNQWALFLQVPEGETFELERTKWRKLCREQIEALIRDRLFIVSALKRQRH